ncbi:MAG TPA: chemotaxis protein CheW [Gemmatimonadales bacterium]|nr:chemotaxis protein CheW [Gemmatimonadales bacterium]
MGDAGRFCTFSLAGLLFGIEVRAVQEVLRSQAMTRVPLAPAVVSGLINLRGQIVTAIDLRRRLGLEPRPDGAAPMNVVVRTEDGAVSLLVDEIGDVIETSGEALGTLPDTLTGEARTLTRGVYKLPDRLLLALDVERALALPAAR